MREKRKGRKDDSKKGGEESKKEDRKEVGDEGVKRDGRGK